MPRNGRRARRVQTLCVLVDPKDEHRNVDICNSAMLHVPHHLLEVRNPAGHLINEVLNRDDLDPAVDNPLTSEDCHLRTDVVNHEGILAELHFES